MSLDDQLSPEEQAFQRADEFTLGDLKLAPFCYTHKSTAIELGLTYWKLDPGDIQEREFTSGKGKKKESIRIQFYDGQWHDTAIVLWLLSITIERVKEVRRRVRAKQQDYDDEIDAFAEKHQLIGGGMTPNYDALAIFNQIMADINVSTAERATVGDGEKKTAL